MPLNPFARPFEPGQVSSMPLAPPLDPFPLEQLPLGVLDQVLCCLSLPSDVGACLAVNKALKQQVADAPLVLDVAGKLGAGDAYGHQIDGRKHQALAGIHKYLPGLHGLLLGGLPLGDDDALQCFSCAPRLGRLELPGCRKLTPKLADALACSHTALPTLATLCASSPGTLSSHTRAPYSSASSSNNSSSSMSSSEGRALRHAHSSSSASALQGVQGGVCAPLRLQALNLQRCFQMNAAALCGLLRAAASCSKSAATLEPTANDNSSHASPASSSDSPPDPSSMHASAADSDGIAGNAEAGSASMPASGRGAVAKPLGHLAQLQCLAMSHLELTRLPLALSLHSATQLNVLALHNCARMSLPTLASILTVCPHLCMLCLGGCVFMSPSDDWAASQGEEHSSAVESLRPIAAAGVRGALNSDWRRSASSAVVANTANVAAHLSALLAASMPLLQVLELTLASPLGLAPATAASLAALDMHGCMLLDLSTATGMSRAMQLMEHADSASPHAHAANPGAASGPYSRPWSSGSGQAAAPGSAVADNFSAGASRRSSYAEHVRLALRCAANCSSPARSTPLHHAAERGDAAAVRTLLSLGAVVNARDGGGATPLFLTCEYGHAGPASVLLAHGADVMQTNAAGEAPLYIAALRGKLAVLEVALNHCNKSQVHWYNPDDYGDGWTPLMAAAVSNRHDVAACVLAAAGASAAPTLVRAANRYGQSALHIAARKGSQQLLRLLLAADGEAASAAVSRPDTSGDTPVDVARKNQHMEALAEFRRAAACPNRAVRPGTACATA